MLLHTPAPDFAALQQRVLSANTDGIPQLLFGERLDDSRYLHWSQLIRRTPPSGLTHEEWWFRLKLQRSAQLRTVPLRMKDGRPFSFALTDEVLKLSEEITRRAGGAVSSGSNALTPAGRDGFVVRSLVEEAITSSQLEGASTSRRVAVDMISTRRDPRTKSERMILNNFNAMSLIAENKDAAFDAAWVRELHTVLTEGTLEDASHEGRLETPGDERVSVWAASGEEVHVPPPASELPERLIELCSFANGSTADSPYIPPVVRAIITHFMFGFDHYFSDGNGRMARTAFYWAMLHNGYWLAEYLTISKILRKAPGRYSDSYQYTEDDDGDLTYFILHQLRVIQRALDELDTYIETRRSESNRIRMALRSAATEFNPRQTQLLEWLTRDGIDEISAADVAARYRVTTQTARNDLRHLENFGLLSPSKTKHPIRWTVAIDIGRRITELGK
ncbi:Fic family protein [Microbacterium sp. MYb64]|uniref:Fic family protein n=1 Tax=Microbacterium sp. MYb64 TaxID=1848691 RepID=UPI000CFBE2D3|nr:Fic family protein [Microbacterium sp. MYb64]PRB03229.1 filamentation induced by cAMP protein fic [Microbacterium sp. MYb64]